MAVFNRRTFLQRTALAVAALRALPAMAQTARQVQPSGDELKRIEEVVEKFRQEFNCPGLSLAIARRGVFVLQRGFGVADEAQTPVNEAHLFRIASVSKPITAVAVLSLIEQDYLGIDDFVFGAQGHLGFDYGKDYPEAVNQITIHHLLHHTAGWGDQGGDPMFQNTQMNQAELIAWTLKNKPLEYAPGTHYWYANFGYCVLGRLIEKISGRSYREFVEETIFEPCGIENMRLATNERSENEVHYFGQNGQNSHTIPIERMDAHGGWIATPTDLVRFALAVDGFNEVRDILNARSIETMTTPSAANRNYACGWNVNAVPNWWHNGAIAGTNALLVRTASGLCWAALVNTRKDGIEGALDTLIWQIVKAVPAWRA